MRISEVARAAGCSVRAIRHYHASGALPEPPRSSNGYREYGIGDLAALLRVRTLVTAGIPLAEIDAAGDNEDNYAAALQRIDARLAALQEQRRRVVALRSGGLGVPPDIRAGVAELLADPALTRLETDALDLMGLVGVATEDTWERLRRNLADPACREITRRTGEAWRHLGRLRANDPAAGPLIDQLLSWADRGLMAGVTSTLRSGDLPLSIAEITVTGAQGRAVAVLTDRTMDSGGGSESS